MYGSSARFNSRRTYARPSSHQRYSRGPSRPVYRRSYATAYRQASRPFALSRYRARSQPAATTPPPQLLQSLVSAHLASHPPSSSSTTLTVAPKPVYLGVDDLKEGKDEKKLVFDDDEISPPPDVSSLRLAMSMTGYGGNKLQKVVLGNVYSISTNGVGTVNAINGPQALGGIPEFGLWSQLFNEFFCVRMHAKFTPVSMFGVPETAITAPANANQPIMIAPLQGPQATYTSAAQMSNVPGAGMKSTGTPWHAQWKNHNRYKSQAGITGTVAFDGWCDVTQIASYAGGLQYLSTLPTTGDPTKIMGTIFVKYYLVFRVRV